MGGQVQFISRRTPCTCLPPEHGWVDWCRSAISCFAVKRMGRRQRRIWIKFCSGFRGWVTSQLRLWLDPDSSTVGFLSARSPAYLRLPMASCSSRNLRYLQACRLLPQGKAFDLFPPLPRLCQTGGGEVLCPPH